MNSMENMPANEVKLLMVPGSGCLTLVVISYLIFLGLL